jgi:hypothetical protein
VIKKPARHRHYAEGIAGGYHLMKVIANFIQQKAYGVNNL